MTPVFSGQPVTSLKSLSTLEIKEETYPHSVHVQTWRYFNKHIICIVHINKTTSLYYIYILQIYIYILYVVQS